MSCDNDYSRYTWVFFLHDKTEVVVSFKKFAKRAQNEFEVKLKKIRSDNGKEFDNTNIEAYCDKVGIKHEVSATYTPQQNSVVERKNRTISHLQEQCLMSTIHPKLYGRKLSTSHVMHPTSYFFKSFLARHLMSCSMGRRRTYLSSGCLVANATSTRSDNT